MKVYKKIKRENRRYGSSILHLVVHKSCNRLHLINLVTELCFLT